MFISKFQVFNYKSFLNSDPLDFKPGLNIIAGANNSGKTALLEALTLKFSAVPHRSIKTLPTSYSKVSDVSKVRVSLAINKPEFRLIIEQLLPILIPYPDDKKLTIETVASLFQQWLEQLDLVYLSLVLPSLNVDISYIDNPLDINFGYLPEPQNIYKQYQLINVKRQPNESFKVYQTLLSDIRNHIGFKVFDFLRSRRIYRFYAERLNLGICSFGPNSELQPDASNLAEVLGVLQAVNPPRFQRFNQLVSVIFPDIKLISIKPKPNQLEIMVWHVEPETEREDLAFPLSSCGTGIGQVLAILYVVLTSLEPQTIIIDEPQSFLNPGAAKKLVEILKEFPQHQYFIATHSPEIIAAANPSTIVKLRYEDSETKASVMNSKDTREQRSLLAELGVSLSDVFGADNILWVEGLTEELCFPLIMKKVAKKPLRGTTILAIKNTGDLEGKRAHIIFDVYDKISGGTSLFPPAIGFVLDREGKSGRDMEDLKRRSQKPVEFLPRRMYENYLLHPEAITAIINEEDQGREKPLTTIEVQEWLDKKKQEGGYLPKGVNSEFLLDSEWIYKVDGANFLKDLFVDFSEARVEFSKTKHSYQLTEWLVDNKPNSLFDLAEFLKTLLDRAVNPLIFKPVVA